MSEQFYICRVWLDTDISKSRFSYMSKGFGWCKTFGEALPFSAREVALIKLNGRSGTVWPESDLKNSTYYLAELAAQKSMTTTALQKSPNSQLPAASSAAEVISAEQGKLIDRAKVYSAAHTNTERNSIMYLFLLGTTLTLLKEATPYGKFEELKAKEFPEEHGSRLHRAMQFSEALKFFAKGKHFLIGNLTAGDRLLAAGELSEKEKAQLVEEMAKTDKGGVLKTIQAWHNKKAPKEKVEPTIEDKFNAEQAQVDALAGDFCKAAFLLLLDPQTLVKLKPTRRAEVLAAGIKVNDAIRHLGKKSK